MVPSLFEGLEATDETTWCAELGPAATERLRRHWDSFVTREDFAWIAAHGPQRSASRSGTGSSAPTTYHPEVRRHRHLRDRRHRGARPCALDWARELGLAVIIDLHAAPDARTASTMAASRTWWVAHQGVSSSTRSRCSSAWQAYHAHPALHGIELLNEPRWDVPTET